MRFASMMGAALLVCAATAGQAATIEQAGSVNALFNDSFAYFDASLGTLTAVYGRASAYRATAFSVSNPDVLTDPDNPVNLQGDIRFVATGTGTIDAGPIALTFGLSGSGQNPLPMILLFSFSAGVEISGSTAFSYTGNDLQNFVSATPARFGFSSVDAVFDTIVISDDTGVLDIWGEDPPIRGGFNTGIQLIYEYTPFSAPVPEPATWAMMIAGFGLIGTAARRRRWAVA